MAERVLLEVRLDGDRLVTDGGRVVGQLDRIGKGAVNAGGAVSRLGGWLKGLIAGAVISQLGRIASGLYEIATAAGETADAFERTFEEGADALNSFIESFANMAGLTRTQARELAIPLGGMARGLGLAGQEAAAFSQRILTLAGDISSLRNVPIADVLRSIQSGIAGETEPMRQYGVFLGAAAVEAQALADRAPGLTGALTEQEKALARLNVMFGATEAAAGNLEDTQDSAANTGRQLNAVIREAREAFAVELLTAIKATQAQLVSMLGDGEGFITWAREAGRAVGSIVSEIGEMLGALGRLSTALGAAEGDVMGLKSALQEVEREIAVVTGALNILADVAEGVGRLWQGIRRMGIVTRQEAEAMRAASDEAMRLGKGTQILGDVTDKTTGALEDLSTTLPEVTAGAGNAAGATDRFKTAIEQAQERVAGLRRELEDLRGTSPDALGALLNEAENLEAESERLIEFAKALDALGGAVARAKVYGIGVEPAAPAGPMSDVDAGDAVGVNAWKIRAKVYGEAISEITVANENLKQSFLDLGPALQDGLGAAVSALSDAVAQMLDGTMGFEAVGAALSAALGDLAVRLGQMMIQFGLSAIAIKKLIKNPYAAIAAGAALIVLGRLAQAHASRLVSSATGGGSSTSASTPASLAPSGVSGLAAGLALQGDRGAAAPIVNVNTGGTTVNVHGRPLEHLIDDIEIVQDRRNRTRGNRRGL